MLFEFIMCECKAQRSGGLFDVVNVRRVTLGYDQSL